jgi:hypothetical protein
MDRETLRLEILRVAYRPNVKPDDTIAQCEVFEAYITEPVTEIKRKPGRPRKADNAETPPL